MKTQKKLWSALAALCVATGTVAQPAYNYSKLQKEQLGRGVVAIRENPSDVVVSWRYLSSDPINTSFNVYRNGEKIGKSPILQVLFTGILTQVMKKRYIL